MRWQPSATQRALFLGTARFHRLNGNVPGSGWLNPTGSLKETVMAQKGAGGSPGAITSKGGDSGSGSGGSGTGGKGSGGRSGGSKSGGGKK
jgi:hypothetical protein